jgi:hypothetical protein
LSDDFTPASSLAPIPGSSYSLRIGKIGDRWAIRVYRGQQILTTEVIGELDPQIIVTVAQSAISLPSYSPYHIVRAVSPLIREAKTGYVPPPPPSPAPTYDQASAPSVATPVEPRGERTPTLISRVTQSLSQPSIPQQPVQQAAPPVMPAPAKATERKPLVEIPPLEPIRPPKKLVLEPIEPEVLADRLYSTLMSHLGYVVTYIYNNYGEKSGARLWEYLGDVAELSQGKRKNESFEEFIKRRVQEDMVLGIEHQVSEFLDYRFVSRVKNCGLKTSVASSEKFAGRFQQDLPCMLCESNWQGSCRAMGFQLKLTKEKDGCTIDVGKNESK